MKPKDIFPIAVRLLGLVFLYHGLLALPGVIPLIFSGAIGNLVMGILMVAWPLAVAWWLIGGAPLLMRRAYPPDGVKDGSNTPAASGAKADA